MSASDNPLFPYDRDQSEGSGSLSGGASFGLIIGGLIVLVAVVLLIVCYSFRGNKNKLRNQKGMITGDRKLVSLKSKNKAYTCAEITKITKNFATVIGEGGFGKVYLGVLKHNTKVTKVAVKVLSKTSKQGYKEFRAEAKLLTTIRNEHLVDLIGYCDEGEHKALIYKFMKKGNLKEYLRELPNTDLRSWKDTINIAVDAAKGLKYLHNDCKPPIVHRDLKTSNILLDEKMRAKLADFGLSRVVTESGPNSTVPAGTFGYMDPKLQGFLSRKMDIYSFGIILFVLITGKPAIIKIDEESGPCHILDWVGPQIERGDIQNIVDPRFKGQLNANAVRQMVNIASSCAREVAAKRPDISHVLAKLEECLPARQ